MSDDYAEERRRFYQELGNLEAANREDLAKAEQLSNPARSSMSETKAFDLTKLQSGDEVGIELNHGDRIRRSAGTIKAIHDDGVFELDLGDWFDQAGRCLFDPECRYLAAPTDEGRLASLQETVSEELRTLASQAYEVDLPTLRRLKAWIDAKGWDACES